MKIRARLEVKMADFWIGLFFRRSQRTWIQDEDQSTSNAIWRTRKAERLDIWVCVLPCIPIHVLVTWRERLLTEEETLETMVAL